LSTECAIRLGGRQVLYFTANKREHTPIDQENDLLSQSHIGGKQKTLYTTRIGVRAGGIRDLRDSRDNRNNRNSRDNRDLRESQDNRTNRDLRDSRNNRDSRDLRDGIRDHLSYEMKIQAVTFYQSA